jgi:flagellar assembly factor FliW
MLEAASVTAVEKLDLLLDEGIIGLSRARRFRIVEQPGSEIYWLRCLDLDGVEVPVVDPAIADADYHPELNTRVKSALGITDLRSVRLLVVANLEPGAMTVNLRAPLVINLATGVGAQVILENKELPLRARVVART